MMIADKTILVTGANRGVGRALVEEALGEGRGLEFLMGYYAILDRVPKGRDEGDGWQLWLRRHDEYA